MAVNYYKYIQSESWLKNRLIAFKKDDRCKICRVDGMMDVHHKTYKRLGNENKSDLILLCRKCHQGLHDFIKNNSFKGKYSKKKLTKGYAKYVNHLRKNGLLVDKKKPKLEDFDSTNVIKRSGYIFWKHWDGNRKKYVVARFTEKTWKMFSRK